MKKELTMGCGVSISCIFHWAPTIWTLAWSCDSVQCCVNTTNMNTCLKLWLRAMLCEHRQYEHLPEAVAPCNAVWAPPIWTLAWSCGSVQCCVITFGPMGCGVSVPITFHTYFSSNDRTPTMGCGVSIPFTFHRSFFSKGFIFPLRFINICFQNERKLTMGCGVPISFPFHNHFLAK